MLLFAVLTLRARILSSSPEENSESLNPNLLEGDMIISPQQVRGLLLGQSRSARFVRRWPNGMVPYTIDWSLEREDVAKSVIAAAIEEWTKKTCLQFKERTSERAYVTFRIGSGCSASVGYQGYQQFVNLAPGCWHMGTVAHEIGHALGFFHEQSRLDRDRFVRVVWYNIQKGMGYNFMKVNHINSLEEPYDFDSVMHYGRTFFSKNGRPTLFPRKKGIEVGQRERESEGDARQMNKMYNCP